MPKFVSFILPRHKADRFNDCRLHDLLSRERTPCYSIWTLGVGIRAQVAGSVDDVVGDICVLFNVREEYGQQIGQNEELEICLERNQLRREEIAKHPTFWYTNPLLGPHPKTLSLLGTPLTAGCELIVKNPRSLTWASFSAMTFISDDAPCSDQGSESTFPRQKSRNTALNVLNSVGDPQTFRASSFYKIRQQGPDGRPLWMRTVCFNETP